MLSPPSGSGWDIKSIDRKINIFIGDEKHITFKAKPLWMYLLTQDFLVAFYPFIYVPNEALPCQDAISRETIMHHKMQHIRQQRRHGKWKWLLLYLTNKAFRLHNEAEAIAAELAGTDNIKRNAILKLYAKQLSSHQYFWCAKSVAHAKTRILDAFARKTYL